MSEEDKGEVKNEDKYHIQKDAKRKSKPRHPSEKCTQFSWWDKLNNLAERYKSEITKKNDELHNLNQIVKK